jgi:hypothetical protein
MQFTCKNWHGYDETVEIDGDILLEFSRANLYLSVQTYCNHPPVFYVHYGLQKNQFDSMRDAIESFGQSFEHAVRAMGIG